MNSVCINNQSFEENFKSLSSFLYCKGLGRGESTTTRFWGRACDLTLVLVLVDLITHTVGYSSVLDYFSVVLYVFAACTLVSLLIFKLDKLKNFSEKSRILIVSTLILVISFAVVGYVIYKMSEATKIAVTSNGMVSAKEFDEPKVDPEQLSKNTEFEVSSKLLAKNESGILIMEGNEFARVDENTPSGNLVNKYAELFSLYPIQDPDKFFCISMTT